MDICPLCGKRILRSGSNWVINDGVILHKKCPTTKKKLSDEDSKDYNALMDRIKYWLANKPKGYVTTTGLNFMKVANQIKQLKDKGYTYKDQLYSIDKVVEMQDGFYGYTAVVNNIEVVMARKRKHDQVLERTKKSSNKEVIFNLGNMLNDELEEW